MAKEGVYGQGPGSPATLPVVRETLSRASHMLGAASLDLDRLGNFLAAQVKAAEEAERRSLEARLMFQRQVDYTDHLERIIAKTARGEELLSDDRRTIRAIEEEY